MKIERNIPYNPSAGERGVGDLFLPDQITGHPVLLIHGGGWNALDKSSIEPMGRRFAERGRAVFNINYRLLDQGPWPACGEDCIAAGRMMLDGNVPGLGTPEKILIAGASAGGHLAMMTGLGLPPKNVEAIISMAGPSLMDFPDGSSSRLDSAEFRQKFYGTTQDATKEQIDAVSPAKLVKAGAPPLFLIHSKNDRLVTPTHSQAAYDAWRGHGNKADLIWFNGPGDSHGFWDSEDRSIRQPIPEVVAAFESVLKSLA
jgi:acetyl esterase/lipase